MPITADRNGPMSDSWGPKLYKKHKELIDGSGLPRLRIAKQMHERTGKEYKGPVVLGCGSYGCVLETDDKNVVFKFTTDPSEIDFIKLHVKPFGNLEQVEGTVKYFALVDLPETHKGRPVVGVWREAAIETGINWNKIYSQGETTDFTYSLLAYQNVAAIVRDVLKKSKAPEKLLVEADRLMTEWAWKHVDFEDWKTMRRMMYGYQGGRLPAAGAGFKGAQKIAYCLRLCQIGAEEIGSTQMSYLVGEALGHYQEEGYLLADVHHQNVGQVKRPDYSGPVYVITDPGHMVRITPGPRAEARSNPGIKPTKMIKRRRGESDEALIDRVLTKALKEDFLCVQFRRNWPLCANFCAGNATSYGAVDDTETCMLDNENCAVCGWDGYDTADERRSRGEPDGMY